MNKLILTGVIAAIVAGGAGFWGGTVYQQNKIKTAVTTGDVGGFRTAFGNGMPGGGAGAPGGGAGRPGRGGLVAGTVVSSDSTSITVKLTDGSTKTVYYTPSTTILSATAGTATDIAANKRITVTGTANSDGSTAATSIELRPAQ